MENKTSTSKFALQYGVLFGVIMILELIVGYIINIDPSTNKSFGLIINLLNFIFLPSLLIYIACNDFKIKLNNGFVSFGECLKIGVTICIIAALIYALFSTVFNIIYPEYMEEMIRKMKIVMQKDPNMTKESVEMGISMIKKMSSPAFSIPITILMYSFIGLVISLIIGAIVKKDPNQSI